MPGKELTFSKDEE